MRVRRILCPVDLSAQSDEALRYAITLARVYEAKLFIFHCVRMGLGMIDDPLQLVEGEARAKKQITDSIARELDPTILETSQCEIVISGCENPGDAIVQEATKRNTDLIVMRSRRRPHRAA